MTTREYPETISQPEQKIRFLEYRLETCCEHAGIRSSAFTGTLRAKGPARSAMEDAVNRAQDLRNELEEARDQLLRKQMFPEDLAIANVDARAAELFIVHYLKHVSISMLAKQFYLAKSRINELTVRVRDKIDEELAKRGDDVP